MRLMVMFNLPVETARQKKNYRLFCKALISQLPRVKTRGLQLTTLWLVVITQLRYFHTRRGYIIGWLTAPV